MKYFIRFILIASVSFSSLVWSEEAVKISGMGAYSLEALKVVMSLALVLFIFYLGVTLFKKYLGGAYKGNSSIRVLGGLSIGHKEKLVLVEAGNVNLLLGVSSAGVNKLHCFSEEEISHCKDQEKIEANSFTQHFNKFTS